MDDNGHSELIGDLDGTGRCYNVSMARVLGVRIVGQQEAPSSDVPVQAALQDGGGPWHRHLVLGVARLEEKLARVDALRGGEAGVEGDAGHCHRFQGVRSNLGGEVALKFSNKESPSSV